MRNNPTLVGWVFGFLLAAVVVSLILVVARPDDAPSEGPAKATANKRRQAVVARRKVKEAVSRRWGRVGLTALSALLYVLSATLFLIGLQQTVQAPNSPQIAVSWKTLKIGNDETLVATISVKLGGLSNDDVLYVTVDPNIAPAAPDATTSNTHLYQSVTGADADGNADVTFDVPIPPGLSTLQVVASTAGPVDCSGHPLTSPQPAPSATPLPIPSVSPSVVGVVVAASPTPKYACVALLVPVPSPQPTPSPHPTASASASP